jgi:hypothetical protein
MPISFFAWGGVNNVPPANEAEVAGSLTCQEKQPTLFSEWNVLKYGWHWQAVGLVQLRKQ